MRPEILAPAGSMEAVKAAVHAGADAVYLGGNRFGARAFANNFDEAALIEAIEYSHIYGVKVYLTVNTLFRNDEIEDLFDYLSPFYQAGLDAVIVQDLGVMKYIHENFPDLPIHASTQMTITTKYAFSLLKDYGVTRIVPARELSMEEIVALKEDKEYVPEVEVFVQGALCYCYSGQCLMSSMLGGRSGNRGRCAQTCRLPYSASDEEGNKIETKGAHLLSPKDLCGLEAVPALIKSGVDSFKIEGRMKKPEYVAACVRAYRRVLDAWYDGSFSDKLIEKCKAEMAEVFNRGGFTKGYYYQKNGKDMMSMKNPGNIGVVIGTVDSIRKNQLSIKLQKDIFKGDILVLAGAKGEITLTSNADGKSGKMIILNAPRTQEIQINQKVSRMFCKPFMEELEQYVLTDKRIALTGKAELFTGQNSKLTLTVTRDGKEYTITQIGELVETAANKPLSKEVILDKIGKMGTTRYYFDSLEVSVSEDVFYSLKALKDLRRNALESLEEKLLNEDRRGLPEKKKQDFNWSLNEPKSNLSAMVSNEEQFNAVVSDGRIKDIYLDLQFFNNKAIMDMLSMKSGFSLYLVLPPVLRQESFKEMKTLLERIINKELSIAGLIVRNIDELAYLKQLGYCGTIVTDYSLYTMNEYAAAFIRGIYPEAKLTVSVELNEKQIKRLPFLAENCEMEVYGRQQLMITAGCLQKNLQNCNKQNDHFVMKDRYQKEFYVFCICKYCYNLIYNGVPTVLFDLLRGDVKKQLTSRLHFVGESFEETEEILDAYFTEKIFEKEKTRGHYNRGVE